MLKAILGALDAARTVLFSDISHLRQGLGGLSLLDNDLAERACQFVAEGTEEAVLIDLRAKGHGAGVVLGDPGRLRHQFYANAGINGADKAAKESLAGRSAFYQRIDPLNPPVDVLVRLGKVLEAADQGKSLHQTGASAPDWLQYLVNDALWASFNHYNAEVNEKTRLAWDIDLIDRILTHEELPSAIALSLVFERRGIDAYHLERTLTRLLAPGPLDAYLLAHADIVESTVGSLSASGKALFVDRLGKNPVLVERFAPLLVRLSVDSSKTVRAAMARHMEAIPRPQRLELLERLLADGQTDERVQAADLLARTLGADSVAMLEQVLARETSKPVQQAIRSAISRLQAADDASVHDLPTPPAWHMVDDVQLGDDAIEILLANRAELLERHRKSAEEEVEQNRTSKHKFNWRQQHYSRYKSLSDTQLKAAVRALNGQGSRSDIACLADQSVNETIGFAGRIEGLPSFGITHLVRWLSAPGHRYGVFWMDHRFQRWLQRQDPQSIDLRMLAGMLEQAGIGADVVGMTCLRNWWGQSRPVDILPADRIWPFFAEHPELIDEGLGLRPSNRGMYEQLDLGCTLDALATFPVVPARWLPRVMEIALGEGKTHRAAAQKVLSRMPDIGKRIIDALGSSKQEIRSEAARWLAALEHREAIPDLYRALDKESRETTRAAMLTALEALGEDISARLAPDVLLAEARKGLKAKPPAGLAWFSMEALPTCTWCDGSPVEPEIIRWWVILACKLKEPGGNALLERYLGLLDDASRANLGSVVLRQFIARDTLHPSLEDGIAHAQANAAQRYQQYQDWYKRYPEYYEVQGKLIPEQVFEQVKREKMAEYLGSAIGEKGILALIHGAPGHEIVGLLQSYMRDHYQRRAQIEAMIEGAAVASDSMVIQLLLGLSRRYRTASVQEKARALVERIAERNGWTQDQLADRTVPTGGFDEHGRLELQYGERLFTVTLDEAMKPVLANADGKVIKALPEPRQNDNPESIKEAKQLFAGCKKELKQVIDMQTARLYEAMCAGRLWPVQEWREYLHRHPIVGRLVQRLVWMEAGADGQPVRLWRPTEDGSLIDVQDDEVELADEALVRLAHGSLVPDDLANAWTAHFKDYKLASLFPQMSRKLPVLPEASGEVVNDRCGWVSDTFTLRGAFTKLGYQRAQAEDGGFFYLYTKDFASVSVRVAIEFSGNTLPEENVAAALKTLSFQNLRVRGYRERTMAIRDVPTVLLAEAYADYHAVAAACSGFDPQWEKKMPW